MMATSPRSQRTSTFASAGRLSAHAMEEANSSTSGGGGMLIPLPPLNLLSGRQEQTAPFRSPRQLGELVADKRGTAAQRRVRMLEDRVVSTHINPIAAWPSTNPASKAQSAASTRPPLSIELENYLRKEQRDLALTKPDATKLDALPIYREVFGCVVHHFHEYTPVLAAVKKAYDAAIEELSMSSQRAAKIELENKSMEGTHAMQLLQEREKMQSCLSDSHAQLQAVLRTNQLQRQHIAKLEMDLARADQTATDRKREHDESTERIRVLGVTLVEEASKMSSLISENRKASQEVDRLTNLVESLRQLVAESERTIQAFRMAPVEIGGGGQVAIVGGSGGSRALDFSGKSFRKPLATAGSKSKGTTSSSISDSSPLDDGSMSPIASVNLNRKHSVTPTNRERGHKGGIIDSGSPARLGSSQGIANEEADALRETIFDLECQVEALQHQNKHQQKELKALEMKLEKYQQLRGRDCSTPRPDWKEEACRLRGFHFDAERSTRENVSEMITFIRERLQAEKLKADREAMGKIVWNWFNDDDMCEADLMHRYKYFIPKGTASNVPPYLRTSKRVRNRRMNKADVELILTQFWTARLNRRKTIPFPPVDEFWMEWATKESGTPAAGVELSYNVLDVCERNLEDPDCKLFTKIMRGELCELIVADQRDSIASLHTICQQLRVANNPNVRITKHNFFKAVRIVFPGKSRDHMSKLRFSLALWTDAAEFDYRDLFSEDGDKSQSKFIELLRKQHIDEIEEFTVEVCEMIRALVNVETGQVCIADAMNSYAVLDPATTDSDVQLLFSNACRITLPDLLSADQGLTTDSEVLLTRLRFHTLLKRTGPSPGEETDTDDDNDSKNTPSAPSRKPSVSAPRA